MARPGSVLVLILLSGLLPALLDAAKKKKKAARRSAATKTQQHGPPDPLHHRTFVPLSGATGADGSILLSSTPKALLHGGAAGGKTVALPRECSIERRDSITAAEFEREFRHRRPLIVTASAEQRGAFSFASVMEDHGDENVTLAFPQTPMPPPVVEQAQRVDLANPRVVRLGLRRMGLRAYMERKYSEADPLYLYASARSLGWKAELGAALPPFAEELGPNISTVVGVGRTGSGLPFHFTHESLVELADGRTFWSLLEPTRTPRHNPERTHGQWLINEADRGGAETLTAGAGRQFCIQERGDWLYVPPGRWQATMHLADTVAIERQASSFSRAPSTGRTEPWWDAWSAAMDRAAVAANAAAQAREAESDSAPPKPDTSATEEVVEQLSRATRHNPKNGAVAQAFALGLLQLAEEGRRPKEGEAPATDRAAAALRRAIELNPFDLKSYYHLARLDWAKSDFHAIVVSLDRARAKGLDIDDDLQQFYQRSWRLMSPEQQAQHPMQFQPSQVGEDGKPGPYEPHYPAGSLGADLSDALAGKGEQSGLLSDLEDQMAEASKPAKESKRAKKKKDKKPIGELSCEVCMRAVDNIYADVHELAQAWAKAHGATPGGEDADDIVQQALGRACATVSPKAVRRACDQVLMWEVASYVEELFAEGLGPFRVTLRDVCVERTGLCKPEELPSAESATKEEL